MINLIVRITGFLYDLHPNAPLVLLMFGVPITTTLIADLVNWKKMFFFVKLLSRYSVVLAKHLLKTTTKNIYNYKYNFKQFNQIIKVQMRQYGD